MDGGFYNTERNEVQQSKCNTSTKKLPLIYVSVNNDVEKEGTADDVDDKLIKRKRIDCPWYYTSARMHDHDNISNYITTISIPLSSPQVNSMQMCTMLNIAIIMDTSY